MKKIIQTEHNKTNLLIFLIGIVGILGSIVFKNYIKEPLFTILISISTSIVASSIVAFITTVYMFENTERVEFIRKWGIKSIYETRGVMNNEVNALFEHKVARLDIIAYGLKSFRESKSQRIKQLLQYGMKMRIITVDPKLGILEYKDRDEGKIEGSTAASIHDLIKWCKEIGKVEVRVIDTLPTELYFRVDSNVFVGPYEIGRESQQTITMHLKGKTDGVKYYTEYFDNIWKNAKKPS